MTIDLVFELRRGRWIDLLRRVHGGTWRYERPATYVHVESGRRVYRCAALAPRFDGDDDSFVSQLRWADTGKPAHYVERKETP